MYLEGQTGEPLGQDQVLSPLLLELVLFTAKCVFRVNYRLRHRSPEATEAFCSPAEHVVNVGQTQLSSGARHVGMEQSDGTPGRGKTWVTRLSHGGDGLCHLHGGAACQRPDRTEHSFQSGASQLSPLHPADTALLRASWASP